MKWIISKLNGLTLAGVCLHHCSEPGRAMERAVGHAMRVPTLTGDLNHWPAVLRSVWYVGKRRTCRDFPNNFIIVPLLHGFNNYSVSAAVPYSWLLFSMCNAYAEIGLLVLVYRVFNMSRCYCSTRLSYIWIVASVTFKFVYTAGFCAGLDCFDS
jgi:hypothetical protein